MKTVILGCAVVMLAACGGKEEPKAPLAPRASATAPPALGADLPPPGKTEVTAMSDNVAKGMKALDSGDLISAKAYFDAAVRKNPGDVDALYYEGYTAEKSGDKAGAEKSYRDALKVKSDHEGAAVNLSGIDDEAQKYDEASNICRNALAKHPDNPSLHLNLAIALAGKADQPGATKEFDQAIAINGNDPMYHLVYGHWLGTWKQTDQALAHLRAARPMAADNIGMLAAIGHEMHMIHAFSDCVPTFDKAIAMKDAAELRTERAACKLGAKDDAGALADLQAAVANEPTYAPAHYYLGGALASGGQFKPAIAEYATFLKLSPSGPLAKAATDKIKLCNQKLAGK